MTFFCVDNLSKEVCLWYFSHPLNWTFWKSLQHLKKGPRLSLLKEFSTEDSIVPFFYTKPHPISVRSLFLSQLVWHNVSLRNVTKSTSDSKSNSLRKAPATKFSLGLSYFSTTPSMVSSMFTDMEIEFSYISGCVRYFIEREVGFLKIILFRFVPWEAVHVHRPCCRFHISISSIFITSDACLRFSCDIPKWFA